MHAGTQPARRLAALRNAPWLTADRARAWCIVWSTLAIAGVCVMLALSQDGADLFGKPIGTDFVSFWTASKLALTDPAAAYDPARHAAAQRALFPALDPTYFAFFYPPPFLLACLPLALLPYGAAMAAWLAAGYALFVTALRRILPQRWALLPILAFPAVLVNATHGQNGLLTAGLFGWGMALLTRRPFLAGACLGLLVIKPHLLAALPVALLFARRWHVIAGAIASATGLLALSWLVLGTDAWRGFLAASPMARATLEEGLVETWKMQSVFAAARLLGSSITTAFSLQAAAAAIVCALLARLALQRPGTGEGAMAAAATLLCTPFLLDYDLTLLALPLAWLAAEAQRTGWRAWEKIVLLAAYVLPLAARPIGMIAHVPVAPLVIGAVLLVLWARARPVPATPALNKCERTA